MRMVKRPITNPTSPLGSTLMSIEKLRPNPKNVRTHSKKQIGQIAESISQFGFAGFVVADEHGVVLAGHGRLEAARLLGLAAIPVVTLNGLSPAKKRAFMLADNKIASNAGYDREGLAVELAELSELLTLEGCDIAVTGFEPVEIDLLASDYEDDSRDPADEADAAWRSGPVVSHLGDVWLLGRHRLVCGNARSPDDLDRLMNGRQAAMVFTDPPYNVRIRGVVGRGKVKHAEFAEASGEQSSEDFVRFLSETLGNAARVSAFGAVHFVCMDWRHAGELIAAGRAVYDAHLNTAIWVKTNAGQGSFYRSQHEQVFVFRVGREAHLNNIELGRHGRSRSNVWTYAGVNTFRAGRMDDLQAHPTVKPVALVVDAMKDCTRRGDIVLDIFAGSGTTILAAERVGRVCAAMELEPRYVDVAIRRWEAFTRRDAVHAATERTFEEITKERTANLGAPGEQKVKQTTRCSHDQKKQGQE